ncbi:MAG: hypothetical protein U9R15_04530 [Chloroflexota bacterium]|nr:hypothetical protein [Chloroflexota bacterium]
MARISGIITELVDILAAEGDIEIYLQDNKERQRLSSLNRGDFGVQTIVTGLDKYGTAVLLNVE